jgi:hypothetical protein
MTAAAEVRPADSTRAADRVSAALRRKIALALLGATALVYMLTAPGHLASPDMRTEFAVAQSMVGKADFTVPPGLPYVTVPYVVGPDGRHYSSHDLGQSLLLVPAALVGRLAGCGDPTSCSATAQHDAEFAASFVDGVAAAVAVMLMFLLALDLGAAVGPALALSLLFGFTTIEWAYAHDAFDVGPTATVLLLTLFAVHRGLRESSTRWLIVGGAAAGFAVALRLPSLLCVPIFAAYVIASTWRLGAASLLRRVVAFGVSFAAAVLLLIGWYNWVRFGDPLSTGYPLATDYSVIGGSPLNAVAGLLFSPGRSILLYSPILIAALAGLPLLWRRYRALTAAVVAIVVVNLGFYAAFPQIGWWGGWNWGPRYFVPMTPFLILPLLPLLQRWGDLTRMARRAIYGLAAAGVVVQLLDIGLEVQHQVQLLRDAGVEPPDAQFWTPQYSGIWRHGEAMLGLLNGSATYPATYQFTDLSTAMPLKTVLDVWWVYAWIDGVNPLVVITVLVGAVAGVVALALWLWRRIAATPSDGPRTAGKRAAAGAARPDRTRRAASLAEREALQGLDAIDASTGQHK